MNGSWTSLEVEQRRGRAGTQESKTWQKSFQLFRICDMVSPPDEARAEMQAVSDWARGTRLIKSGMTILLDEPTNPAVARQWYRNTDGTVKAY